MTANVALRAPTAALGLFAAVLVGIAAPYDPMLVLAIVGVAAAAAVLLAWPETAILLVVFLFFTNAPAIAVKFHGLPLTVGAMLPLLLLVPLAHQWLRGERLRGSVPLLLILLFFGVELLSTMGSREPDLAWEKTKTTLIEGVLLYFLVLNTVRTPQLLRRSISMLLLGAALLGALSLYQEMTGSYSKPYGGFAQVPKEFFTGHAPTARLAGPLGDPNYYAQMLLVVVPLGLLALWGDRSRGGKLLAGMGTALAAAGVTLTFSRGAGLAFVVVLGLMTVLRYVRWYQVVLVVGGVFLLLNLMPAYKDRVATLSSLGGATSTAAVADSEADMSMKSRLTEMLAAAHVFVDHPFLGVGPDVFPSYYQEYANKIGLEVRETVLHGARKGESAERESHNMFLSIAADLGGIGLGIFLAIIGFAIRDLVRARRRCLAIGDRDLAAAVTGFVLAIAAYVTTGMFLTLAFERYFWLVLALAGAAASIAATRADAKNATIRSS